MESGSAWRLTSLRPAKASRPCYRCEAFCRSCPCSPRSRPITSRRFSSRATLRRLYIARGHDPAGDLAAAIFPNVAHSAGIEALTLSPVLGDFNEDLCRLGVDELRAALRVQLAPEDVPRFLISMNEAGPRR